MTDTKRSPDKSRCIVGKTGDGRFAIFELVDGIITEPVQYIVGGDADKLLASWQERFERMVKK